jgi:hypothetical protein
VACRDGLFDAELVTEQNKRGPVGFRLGATKIPLDLGQRIVRRFAGVDSYQEIAHKLRGRIVIKDAPSGHQSGGGAGGKQRIGQSENAFASRYTAVSAIATRNDTRSTGMSNVASSRAVK